MLDPSPAPSPDHYKVSISAAQNQVLIEGAEWASRNSLRQEYLAALKELNFRLKFEADEWGEGREFLPALGLRMRCGTCKMITAVFGVDEARRIVYVKRFRINQRYRP